MMLPEIPIDYSDRIAYAQVNLQILMQFDPDGEWAKHPTLQKWQQNRYGLTVREFKEMERFLEDERERITEPINLTAYV